MLAAAAVVAVLLTQGDTTRTTPTAAGVTPVASGPVQFYARVDLGRWASRPLPGAGTVISFDLALRPGARVSVGLGDAAPRVTFARTPTGAWSYASSGRTRVLPDVPGWAGPDIRHVEATLGPPSHLVVDGRALSAPAASLSGGRLSLRAVEGSAQAQAVVISAGSDRPALLLHRLTELHARLVPGARLVGSDRADRLYFGSDWTSGFWPGALWQAAALQPEGRDVRPLGA